MDRIFRLLERSPTQPTPVLPNHPYSPSWIAFDTYEANNKTAIELLITFGAVLVPVLGTAWLAAAWYSAKLTTADRLAIVWFTLCGALHTFFEGYYVLNHDRLPATRAIPAQLWKEYALSDSRYLTSDTFVLAAEGLTVALLGPLCWTLVYLISTSSPYRVPVQIMVCFGHIYSDILYYATSLLDYYVRGTDHCRPEAYYFWFYYVGMNSIWIIVPGVLLVQAVMQASRAFAALDRMAMSMQRNGVVTVSNGKIDGR